MDQPETSPIFDCHSHYFPESLMVPLRRAVAGKEFAANLQSSAWDHMDEQIARMNACGVAGSGVTYSAFLEMAIDAAGLSRSEGVRMANDAMAEAQARYPGRIVGAAAFDAEGGKEALAELRRALDSLRMRIIHMITSYDGLYPDDPRFWPVYEMAAEYNVPIFVHPFAYPANWEQLMHRSAQGPLLLRGQVGMLLDTTLCIGRLAQSGVFDRFPQTKFLFCQLGGFIPFSAGRFDSNYLMHRYYVEQGMTPPSAPVPVRLRDYFGHFWVDIHAVDGAAIACAVRQVGIDRVVMGTDAPYRPLEMGLRLAMEALAESGLTAEEQRRIICDNGRALLAVTP
ncbi:MAG: amidohydrolase family protein [Deltaproteobacteria bacterium]|nr:amidohydrolase family protein [Deltaproteobacteria bacterium]